MWAKISSKLIVAVSVIVTVAIGTFAYVIVNSYQRQFIADVESYAEQLSETIISSTRYDMMLNRRESLHQIINMIGRQEGIEKVRIFNKEGAIIFSTDSLDVGTTVDMQTEACYACHAVDQPLERVPVSSRIRIFEGVDGHRISGIISPIYNEPSCWESDCHAHRADQQVLGVLDVTMSLEAVDQERRANIMQLLILTVLVIGAISLLIYLYFGRIVLKPISQLVTATRRVAGGDLAYKVPNKKKDEIGDLAKSFNEMTKRLQETQLQLIRSDKLASAGRLAAGVAHEINNPLTGVLTYSSLLLRQAEGDSAMKEDLEVIVRETKRCREIVKGLLDFSRQSTPEKRRIFVRDVITRAARILQNELAINKILLVLDFQENLPEVYADANQLQQVFVNLFSNAADAMSEDGGTITVETKPAPETDTRGEDPSIERVQIQVGDTGVGIPADSMEKIFEPFFSTKGQEGNGLGLAIVWGIIEGHDGEISVESELNKGTTFTIVLPAANRIKTAASPST